MERFFGKIRQFMNWESAPQTTEAKSLNLSPEDEVAVDEILAQVAKNSLEKGTPASISLALLILEKKSKLKNKKK